MNESCTLMQDWYATERSLMQELKKLVVDQKRFTVRTSGELLKQLCIANVKFKKSALAATTLNGWFEFPGVKSAAALPRPTERFLRNLDAGHNVGLYAGSGRKPKIVHAESVQQFKDRLRAVRDSGVSLNIPAMRALFLGILLKNEQQHRLSPHLLDSSAARDTNLFCCSDYWMRCFLQREMK